MHKNKGFFATKNYLTLLGCTFFNRPFLYEKRGLEGPNFVTFPNSLSTFRISEISENQNFFWFFTMFLGDLEGAG